MKPTFDPDSPYTTSPSSIEGRYARLTPKGGHHLADGRGRVMAHRAVLWDAIGEGPHPCQWCKWPGLRWDAGRRDPEYLVVDHVDGNGLNCQLANLRAACSWCNNNRSIVEQLHIPWSTFEGVPPQDRPPLRVTHGGAPTAAALALAKAPPPVLKPVVPSETTLTPIGTPPPQLSGWVRWEDVIDLDELAKGNVRLRRPPAELFERYPQLHRVKAWEVS